MASKPSPDCAGWDRRDAIGDTTSATVCAGSTGIGSVASSASFSAAIDRVQEELKELDCGSLQEVSCISCSRCSTCLPLSLLFLRMRSMVSLC